MITMENDNFYEIEYSEEFIEHVELHRKSGNKSILIKINNLLNELRIHPYIGTGNPEPLKYDKKGQWSRRITQKHRLVYEVNEDRIVVYIISAIGHYDD